MLNSPSFIYLATILPPILLGIVIWKSDKFQEPGKFLVTAFLLGVAIDLPLHLLILLSENQIAPLINIDLEALKEWEKGGWKKENAVYPAGADAFMNFFRAAFLEEGIKFALLIFICVRLEAMNEPMDAIIYGAAIGLGYAAMENIGYLNMPDAWTLEMVKIRYYPMIMHLGFGVVMGWLLSQNLFDETSEFKRRFMLIISLAIPVIYHGSYNYLKAADIFPALTIILVISIMYWARKNQSKKITEQEDKYVIQNSDVAYSYLCSLALVSIVVISAMLYS